MMLRFGERSPIDSAQGLDDHARSQIIASGKLYDGEAKSAEERLADDGSETSWKGYCYRAPIFDGDRIAYDAWFYMVDSGTIFRVGTTDCVAMIIQCGLECDDAALRDELGKAMVVANLLPPTDASYARFKALVDATAS